MKKLVFLLIWQLVLPPITAQLKRQLSLEKAIELANDSSMAAFQSEYLYLASYWDYKNFQASCKPMLNLNSSPLSYDRTITRQFNAADTSYSYYGQNNLNSTFGLSLNQNIALTGGSISVNSDLNRIQNFGSQQFTQFSSSPIWIGLTQPLFAYNSFKWDKKIAPLKLEKAKKELISSYQENAFRVVGFFFQLAMAEQNFKIASTNLANADTLYAIGKKRFEISTITRMDLLNLKLELLNSKDQLTMAKNNLDLAHSQLLSFLCLDKTCLLELVLPVEIPDITVTIDKALSLAKTNNPKLLDFTQQMLEAQRNVESTKKQNQPQVSLHATYGLNKTSAKLLDAYKSPRRQEYINLNVSLPLVDWGLRKGQFKLVSKQRDAKLASIKQGHVDFEEEITSLVSLFNVQGSLVRSALEASAVANEAYEISKIKFMIGQVDVNDLIVQLNRKDSALRNYISALQDYWQNYYAVRRITLYDFNQDKPLTVHFGQIIDD